MRDEQIGMVVRAVRHRKRWRQEDCSSRAGVHRSTWSLLERGRLDEISLPTLRKCLAAVDIRMEIVVRWQGAELDRLLDAGHSSLQAAWKGKLERWRWLVVPEASFNHYGDRGRIDLLAWHPPTRVLLVVEVKTVIADVQGLLGPLDIKVRLAAHTAGARGWGAPSVVLPCLIVADTRTNRRRLSERASLFSHLDLRGREAISWLRRRSGQPSGLLILSDL